MTTPYIDPNIIFAENAPIQDKPAAFANYDKGMDETRKNEGRPTIPQFNFLQQQNDLKNRYIHENGAALPYKEGVAYEENAIVVKDGELQQWKGGEWIDVSSQEVKKYLLAAGVDESELDGDYNYLMQRLAQIAVDKGWDASFVVDASGKTQQEINNRLEIPVERDLAEKWNDNFNVKDNGAKGNNINNDATAIQTSGTNKRLTSGAFKIDAPLLYKKDETWTGVGKSFGGTVIRPSGNFPALTFDTSNTTRTKNKFEDFQIEAINLTTATALELTNNFLSEFNRIWIRNAPLGVSLQDSDSVTFNQLMVMEDVKGLAVLIGDSARNIRFFGCNFERNPGNTTPEAGHVIIDGNSGFVASASFYGSQLERSALNVKSGTAKWYGGKVGASSKVIFGVKSSNCAIDSDVDDASSLYDFGWSNKIENAYSENMSTPVFFYPNFPMESGKTTLGRDGEYLIVASAGSRTNAGVSGGKISLKDGTTLLAESPSFDLQALGVTVGLTKRPAYTFISCVKASTTDGITVEHTNCQSFALRGGKNMLSNGTFDGGSTGWTIGSATAAMDANGDLVVTPSATSWAITQTLTNHFIPGKRYIALAKYSGEASLVHGVASNGTTGSRPSYSEGIADLYGDGDTVAQIAFEYKSGQANSISLGYVGSNAPVTVKWIALIEMSDSAGLRASKIFDPASISVGASLSTTVTLAGAVVGDCVIASFSQYHTDIEISAVVSALNTVTVKFRNTGAAAVDLASGILTVKLI